MVKSFVRVISSSWRRSQLWIDNFQRFLSSWCMNSRRNSLLWWWKCRSCVRIEFLRLIQQTWVWNIRTKLQVILQVKGFGQVVPNPWILMRIVRRRWRRWRRRRRRRRWSERWWVVQICIGNNWTILLIIVLGHGKFISIGKTLV
jgi:hypothetical protein